jgi:hypothetical protein
MLTLLVNESASTSFEPIEAYVGKFDITYGDQTGATGDYFNDTVIIGGATVSGMIVG